MNGINSTMEWAQAQQQQKTQKENKSNRQTYSFPLEELHQTAHDQLRMADREIMSATSDGDKLGAGAGTGWEEVEDLRGIVV